MDKSVLSQKIGFKEVNYVFDHHGKINSHLITHTLVPCFAENAGTWY